MMNITLLNPPHTAIGSRLAGEHLPPLGLLSIGGPLIDDGHKVRLIDADLRLLSLDQIIEAVAAERPELLMIGHSGSSSVHTTVLAICKRIKQTLPDLTIVYGGVHPTYHWDEILTECPDVDVIVKGEGEHTVLSLARALQAGRPLAEIDGLAFREQGRAVATKPAPVIQDLDVFRIGWELIDHSDYSYWRGKRAVVVQFSRGCPHQCSYCGQRGFWTTWRHRDPELFAMELARLHREQGVELINFADELPTGSRSSWKRFLEAMIEQNVPLILVGSTRAGDIVRDKDILHLYKKAGVIRFLLGIEAYSDETIAAIKKGGSVSQDRQAIALLRAHGIVSMATYVIGFQEERDADFWQSFKHLRAYDPDQVQLVYATPHRWTPFYRAVENRRIVQTDSTQWDYKHQILETPGVPTWRVFMWFKLIEVLMQVRPRVLLRMFFHRDAGYRHAMRWYTRIGRRVWFHELFEFAFRTKQLKAGPTLKELLGTAFENREYAMRTKALADRYPPMDSTARCD